MDDQPVSQPEKPIPLGQALEPFLNKNPTSELDEASDPPRILKPWGDATLELWITPDVPDVVASLNSVYLPPKFSALYHWDSRSFEFAWGLYQPGSFADSLLDRNFTCQFDGETALNCGWSSSSPELIAIADAFEPSGPPGTTNWRNLLGYHPPRVPGVESAEQAPLSFWVRDVECDEAAFTQIARNLNFLMSYYDLNTPIILIHEGSPSGGIGRRATFPYGPFPGILHSRRMDPYLLGLWETATLQQDVFLKYLYNYQVLEYAVVTFRKHGTDSRIMRLLAAPDVQANPRRTMARILEALDRDGKGKDDETQRMRDLVQESANAELVWGGVEPNLALFAADMVFDGGFTLTALLKPGATQADFVNCYSGMPDKFRSLRNAIVHSKETHPSGRVNPTPGNYRRVRIWLEPLKIIASEIVLHSTAEEEG